MTIQAQVSVQAPVYTFGARDYDVYAGLDVDRRTNQQVSCDRTFVDCFCFCFCSFPASCFSCSCVGLMAARLAASNHLFDAHEEEYALSLIERSTAQSAYRHLVTPGLRPSPGKLTSHCRFTPPPFCRGGETRHSQSQDT